MLKVCISRDTGGRKGGHLTEYAFYGLPGVEIAALADVNPEAEKNYRLTGAKRRYESYFAMVEAEHPDVVVLCSRLPDEHYEQIKFALTHDCHVFCEKPLAATLEQADELLALSRKTGHLVQMAHPAGLATRRLAGPAPGLCSAIVQTMKAALMAALPSHLHIYLRAISTLELPQKGRISLTLDWN